MSIHDEEILGLLGPNGAGKTTLMLMMGEEEEDLADEWWNAEEG